MPCRSDYMEPNAREKESLRVIMLLKSVGLLRDDENFSPSYGDTKKLDEHTARLCNYCKNADMDKQSKLLHLWWLEHQIADEKREEEERIAQRKADKVFKAEKRRDKLAEKALDKLSKKEANALYDFWEGIVDGDYK